MKINFEHLEVFIDIEHTQCVCRNIKKDFANLIYTMGSGIECHALALKIFNGNADTEYTHEECELIKELCLKLCTPAIYESVSKLLTA